MDSTTPIGDGRCQAIIYTPEGDETKIDILYHWRQSDLYGIDIEVELNGQINPSDYPNLDEDIKFSVKEDIGGFMKDKSILQISYI